MFNGKWGYAGIEALEARQLLTVTLDPVGDVSYPGGKSIFVPINGTTTGTSPLGYQVSTSDGRISARVLQNITFVDMNISIGGVAQTPIRLALFGDIAPVTVGRFLQLVNSGFYNGLKFHRIIPGFMAQGGDPLGTGTGGSGTRINDEYNAEAIFSTTGLLAMANSNNGSMNDTNDSQFFITAAQTRWLDFRHTIFGQMISGQATFNAMMAAGSSDGTPTRTVVITSAAVVQDLDTTVLVVKGPANVPGQVTITASSAAGSASRTFNVTGANDSANNDPPFLNPLQDVSIAYWQTATVTPTGTDLEGDGLFYAAQVATSDTNHIDVARDDSGTYTIIPKPGFVGTAHVLFGVYRPATPTAAASWDTQWIAVTVTGPLSLDSANRTVKVSGSDGNDKVTLSVSGGMLVAKLGSYTQRFALGDFDKVVVDLGDGDDSLTASAAVPPMVVSAGAGNDTIRGGGSGDTIYGQAGDDSIRGNGGDDWIEGGTGDDRITGDAGNDKLLGGDGTDWIQGGIGNDWIESGAAAGMLYGGSGNDTVIGAEGDDTIFGDAGDDQLWARGGGDSVRGGTGNDSLWGEDGADLLRGDAGNDSLEGGLLADTLYGGSGNDTLRGGEDGDSLLGESGNDQAYGAAGDDTILGSSGNDTLLGEDGADLIRGDAGNDSIDGGIANDTLYGGAGNDTLTGGPGSDSILGEVGIDYLYVQDDGGIDNVDGGKGLDHAQKDDADVLLNVEDDALIQA